MSHSPKPWKIREEPSGTFLDDAEGKVLLGNIDYYPWIDFTESDWKLVSKSTELLQSLKDCANLLECCGQRHSHVLQKAYKIIEEAE